MDVRKACHINNQQIKCWIALNTASKRGFVFLISLYYIPHTNFLFCFIFLISCFCFCSSHSSYEKSTGNTVHVLALRKWISIFCSFFFILHFAFQWKSFDYRGQKKWVWNISLVPLFNVHKKVTKQYFSVFHFIFVVPAELGNYFETDSSIASEIFCFRCKKNRKDFTLISWLKPRRSYETFEFDGTENVIRSASKRI